MPDLLVRDIPDEILERLELLARKAGTTTEEYVLQLIVDAVRMKAPSAHLQITAKQLEENLDLILAAYAQEQIEVVGENGQRLVVLPRQRFELLSSE